MTIFLLNVYHTFDIASNLLVGKDGGSQTPLGHLFEDWCAGLFTIPIPLPWTKFGKALRCRQALLQYIEDLDHKIFMQEFY